MCSLGFSPDLLRPCAGADVNVQNGLGNTATHFARAYGYDGIYQYLVERGADLTLSNADGATADTWVKSDKFQG